MRVYFAQCPSCSTYARYIIDRGPGWAVLLCPVCDPVLLVGCNRALPPSHYAHLWHLQPRPRYPWHAPKVRYPS